MRYFISYTENDKSWAEWIAWQIESYGYETVIQAWDFTAGSNFVLKMHEACLHTDATIVVLSDAYLHKDFPASEWAEAFSRDPSGGQRVLIPVRVERVEPKGLLSPIVYIDLYGVRNENEAVLKLNQGISKGRSKPMTAPPFPNNNGRKDKPNFPAREKNEEQDLEVEIEIRINQEYDKFTPSDQAKILNAIGELLNTNHNIRVVSVDKGSVILTVALKRKDALKLHILKYIGKIGDFEKDNSIIQISVDNFLSLTIDDILREYNAYQAIHAPVSSRQHGTVVFINQHADYGILLSEEGFYLKFRLEENGAGMSVGSDFEFEIESGTVRRLH